MQNEIKNDKKSHPYGQLIRKKLKLRDRLILSLDVSDKSEAIKILRAADNKISTIKIGLELIYSQGLQIINTVKKSGYKVMLDAKLMDIPNTVAGAVKGISKLGVEMITIHTFGGDCMLKSAVNALNEVYIKKNNIRPLFFGVTVLTSLDDFDLAEFGYSLKFSELVLKMARIAIDCKIDGIICSPNEVKILRENFGENFLIATPGIRLVEDDIGDQKRVNTPQKAIRDGADFIIAGRSITSSSDVGKKINSYLEKIERELKG